MDTEILAEKGVHREKRLHGLLAMTGLRTFLFFLLTGSALALTATERLLLWRPLVNGGKLAGVCSHVVKQDGKEEGGVHLSRYCGDGTVFPSLGSRTQAKNAAHRGELLLNGAEARGHTRVKAGDLLTLPTPPPPPLVPHEVLRVERLFLELTAEAKPQGVRLETLYEDDDMAVVLKPPGIHSTSWSGTQRSEFGRTELCLSDVLPLLLSPPPSNSLPSPLPAHRLDARVGGVLAVAKTRHALASLSRLFASRSVSKIYRAVVAGHVLPELLASMPPEQLASANFGFLSVESVSRPGGGVRIEQHLEGDKLATTELTVLREDPCSVNGVLSTLELRPLTGRRHQLRTACAQCCGAPIIGDDLYHDDANAVRANRGLGPLPPVRRKAGLYLQAVELALPHPRTGLPLVISCPEMPRFAKLRSRAASGAVWSDAEWEAWRAPAR